MSALRLVVACALASVVWLVGFGIGARTHHMLVALTILGVAAVFGALFVPSVRRRLRPKLVDVLWGIAVGGVSLGATYGLYPFVRAALPWIRDDVRTLYATIPAQGAAIPIVALIIVAEELLWRGVLLRALRADHPLPAAIVLSTALYAAAQLGLGVPVLAGVAFSLGGVWTVEAALTRGLVAPLVSHAMWTLTVFSFAPLEK